MPEQKIREDIEKLRAEIQNISSDDVASTDKLESILQDLESSLASEDKDEKQNEILAGLKESITQFETDHPRATAIINDIMVTLSNMGI